MSVGRKKLSVCERMLPPFRAVVKLITYKYLNSLASNYLRQFLIRNSQQSCRPLRNTDKDVTLSLKKLIIGEKDILSEKQNRGTVSQLVLKAHHLWHLLSYTCK